MPLALRLGFPLLATHPDALVADAAMGRVMHEIVCSSNPHTVDSDADTVGTNPSREMVNIVIVGNMACRNEVLPVTALHINPSVAQMV